jgi:hypothetical protein
MENPNYYAKEFRGTQGEIQNVYRKPNLKSSGSISSPAYSNFLTYALYGVLGTDSVAGPTDSAYTHTFKSTATSLPIWTVFLGKNGSTVMEKYRDMTMKSLKLGFKPGEPLSAEVDFEGGPVDIATNAATPSYATIRSFFYPDVTISIAGSPTCDVEEMELMITREPSFNKTMCTGNKAWMDNTVYPTTVKFEGSMTAYFTGYSEYEYWLGATGATTVLTDTFELTDADRANFIMTATSTGDHIGAGTTHESLTITATRIMYDVVEVTPVWDERVKVKYEFKSIYDSGQAAGLETVQPVLVTATADPAP